MGDPVAARHNMVESQIRTNKVTDPRVIAAFLEVPREQFVPKAKRGLAYIDEDIALGGGRYMIEPMVLARLLQLAEAKASDLALDIGCGAGYAAAILARLCSTVVAVECDPALAEQAQQTFHDLAVDNVAVIEGPLEAGYAKQAPYDLVLFNGAAPEVPKAIADQVAEGGRVVAVLREADGVGRGTILRKSGGVLSGRAMFDAATPLLPGFARAAGFVF
jgi:protein-L-isoaspartate(D-aspartate) O-methyltransferase